MKVVERGEREIHVVASDVNSQARCNSREMGIDVVPVYASRRIGGRRSAVSATSEVGDDENSKLSRFDTLRLEVLVWRDVQRNFGALITHGLEPRRRLVVVMASRTRS